MMTESPNNPSSHIGDVILGDAEATIRGLEAEVETQRAEIDRLQSLLNEVSDVKENARALLSHVSEQNKKNGILQEEKQALQKELKGARKELAKCVEEQKTQESRKTETEASLSMKLSSQNEQISELTSELERLTNEYITAEDESQKTISKLNKGIRIMAQEIAKEREIRDQTTKDKTQLENKVVQLSQGILLGENVIKEKDQEMEQLNSELREYKNSVDEDAEAKRKLQEELERVRSDLTQERQMRGKALRGKSELESKVYELTQDLAAAENQMKEKDQELKQLNDQVEEYRTAAEKDNKAKKKLQSDLDRATNGLRGETEGKEWLQSELEKVTSQLNDAVQSKTELEKMIERRSESMAIAVKNAETAMEDKERELLKLDAQLKECMADRETKHELNGKLQLELEQIRIEMRDEAAAKSKLHSKLDRVTSEMDEALQSKLELWNKVEQLNQDIAAAEKSTETAMQEKDRELQQLSAQVEGYILVSNSDREKNRKLRSELDQVTIERRDEAETNRRLQSELEQVMSEKDEALRSKSELESKVDQLSQEIESIEKNTETSLGDKTLELQHLNAQLKECKVAMEREAEARKKLQSDLECVTNERDEILQSNTELQNKVDQLSCDMTIAEKDAETAMHQKAQELQILHAQTEQLKAARDSEAESKKTLQVDLERVSSELVEVRTELKQVRDDMRDEAETNRRLQSELERVVNEKDEALGYKSELESKVDQLRQDIAAIEKNAETSLGDKTLELQHLNAQLNECKAATEREAEAKRKFQSDLECVTNERDEALQANTKLQNKFDQLSQDMAIAEKDAESAIHQKTQELQILHAQTEQLKSARDSEAESRKTLQINLERVSSELVEIHTLREETSEDNNKEIQQLISQVDEYKVAMANETESKEKLQSEIKQLTNEKDKALQGKVELQSNIDQLSDTTMQELTQLRAHVEKYKVAADMGSESNRKLQLELEGVTREISAERQLKEKALRDKSELEDKLRELEGEIKSKDLQVQLLNAQADEYKAAVEKKPSMDDGLQSELKRLTNKIEEAMLDKSQLESKIDQLSQDMDTAKRNGDSATDDKIATDTVSEMNGQLQSEEDQVEKREALHEADARQQYLHNSLGNLAALWEERLAENRKARGIDMKNGSSPTVSDLGTANGSLGHSDDDNTPPSTIYTSPEKSDNQNEALNNGRTPRRSVRLGGILSRFGSQKSESEHEMKSNARLERMVGERDRTINELEAVICSNIDIIVQLKYIIDEMNAPDDASETSMANNIAQLKGALVAWGSAEILALQTRVKDLVATATLNGMQNKTLQKTVSDLESTVSLQGMQNRTLKGELTRLHDIINAMETSNSTQEDDVEALKAKVLKLELTSQLQDHDSSFNKLKL